MVKRVCLVSGGSGGHLVPALVLARALQRRGDSPLLVTEGRAVEREFLARDSRAEAVEEVDLGTGKPSLLGMPAWLLRSTLGARAMLKQRDVDCVVSTGGATSLPVGLAARSLGRPLFLLEQNAVAGRANRWLLPLARRMYLGLPGDVGRQDGRRLFTGTPLRPELYDIDRRRARAELDLQDDVPVVLVTGGSQGAETLNRLLPMALGSLGLPLQVLHLSGNGRDEAVRRSYAQSGDRGLRACVRPMAMDMDRLLGAADLVVCRGGGTTVAELMAAGRPAVIVPYPHHRDRQQVHNAEVLVRAGAAVLLEEKGLDALTLATVLGGLLRDRARLSAMGEAARRQAVADPCAAILADMQQQGGLA